MRDPIQSFYLPPPEPELPLYWTGLGEETRRSPRYRWHGLRRGSDDYLIWQCTLSGRGCLEIPGQKLHELGPGRGFLARLPSDHCYFYRPGDPAWHFVWIMWAGAAVEAIWRSLNKTNVRLTSSSTTGPEIRFVRSLARERTNGVPSTRSDSTAAYRLLLDLCRPEAATPRTRRTAALTPSLDRALRKRPGAPIGKDGLAASLDVSRFQLYRAVRRETGLSPKGWTSRRRVSQACGRLRTTNQSVAEIAAAVGLPDANYFARFFLRQTGFTPSAWRRVFSRARPFRLK
jgi:AraC-like DNA-binding protein